MTEYKKTKTDLMELKSEKTSLLVQQNDEKKDNFVINYLSYDNTIVISEVYKNSSISEIYYHTKRDKKK